MDVLWQILVQFVFRLTAGMAASMGITSSKLVNSGFFRVHLWVLMGLNTLAALVIFSNPAVFAESPWGGSALLALAVALAVASYAGAVVWLYEARHAGQVWLWGIAVAALLGACAVSRPELGSPVGSPAGPAVVTGGREFAWLNAAASSSLLGLTMTSMLLGHWYLNSPGMQLQPLKRLVLALGGSVLLRAAVAGAGLALVLVTVPSVSQTFWIFLSLRWLAGILGTGVMAVLTWYTLKVPNTQSATGILYAALILAFIGELTSLLLSVNLPFPV